MSFARKPVWPTVVLGTSLILGYAVGLEKQQGLYQKAKAKVEQERKLVDLYREEYRQELLMKQAEARGEDVSVYGVPPGLRDMARTIKSTKATNTAGASTEETKQA